MWLMAGEPIDGVVPGGRLPPDVEEAISRLGPPLATRLRYLREVDSTNDEALRLAAAGAEDGTAVLAGLQRQGRGRRGRAWFSPAGAGVYLSVVVRPCDWAGGASLVTLGAGVAAARAVTAASGLPVELKWPNDLVVGRPWRKLGGVLSEAAGGARPLDAVVVGIGINLRPAAYPRDLADRATSIETELGRTVDRGALVAALLAALADVVGRMRRGETAGVLTEWRALGRTGLGRAPVRWQQEREWRSGVAVDVDDAGALVVESGGRRERIVAGEVFWERVGS
jgi:BirA family biotin operon repressor/biotin-[acetyl-CoA-carboxylase] ligase